jgi:hypothetical protein
MIVVVVVVVVVSPSVGGVAEARRRGSALTHRFVSLLAGIVASKVLAQDYST